jgi:arylsulfatase A-like enzyme
MRYLAWLIVACGSLCGACSVLAARPNILVIVGDDMGYADIGVHGCRDIPTPHLDSLAVHGIRCTSGYVSGPYCSPTRAGLLTGRYQQRFGHEFNPGPDPTGEIGLPLTETTLPDRLRKAGYATGMVGKWHLGNAEKFHPLNRGFDEFYGFLGGARSFFPLAAGKGGNAGVKMYRGREVVPEDQPYTTDTFAREATAFIDRHAQHEWFLYLPFNAVHTPMHATEKYLDRFAEVEPANRRTYCAMMAAMDDAVGAVLAKLAEHKLTENTLIFFISDNGGPPVNASNNGTLRGFKAQTWEGGIRVPFLVQWPGKLPAGKVYDQPVIQLDIGPTALAAVGVSAADARFDGVNLLPYFTGEASGPPHESLFWRFGDQMAIRHGNYKLVNGRGAAGPMLFDLAADIGEQRDLLAAKPEVAKDLQARYDAWNATLEKPRWGQPNRQLGTFKKKAGQNKAGQKKAGQKKTQSKTQVD